MNTCRKNNTWSVRKCIMADDCESNTAHDKSSEHLQEFLFNNKLFLLQAKAKPKSIFFHLIRNILFGKMLTHIWQICQWLHQSCHNKVRKLPYQPATSRSLYIFCSPHQKETLFQHLNPIIRCLQTSKI